MPKKELKDIFIAHITHIDNLASIVADAHLYSDAMNLERKSCAQQIGMSKIKQRRLTELPVTCHSGTMVGEYVPFYFHHHSPMLYLIHIGNAELEYKDGQEKIVYLVSKMQAGIEWADENLKKWCFTSSNAGAYICDFYDSIDDLDKVNWEAVSQEYWQECKEEKQAEFLIQDAFPFELFTYIGVYNDEMLAEVNKALEGIEKKPIVAVQQGWYYKGD